jgi:hypothetical protein
MDELKMIVGGSIEDDAVAFLDAWHRAERGETICDLVLTFESREGLAQVMTGER